MTRALAQLNRFFVSPEFSVSYRRAKQLQWQTHATAGYSLLVALDGQLTYELDSQSFQLHPRRFVLFEPGAASLRTCNAPNFFFSRSPRHS